jgi:dihydroorotase
MKNINSTIINGNFNKFSLKNMVEEFSILNPDFDFKKEYVILPGFCDVHVHFREPGFSYKETILTGCKSASRGGYTTVFTMPNLNPVPDTLENLNKQLDLIFNNALINVYPYGSITKGLKGDEISDMQDLAPYVIAFTDDGRGVQNEEMMIKAIKLANSLNKITVCHCEVNSLLNGGYIHDGEYAKNHNHKGICSESEYLEVERDINIAEKLGAKLHICHVSTKESVELIKKAKMRGVDVTCETAPHYLVLDDSNLKESGDFKMNPPLRSKEDKIALINGVIDGTIDMIATDHAPHSLEEKSKGLEKSAFGVVGLETAFPILYTYLVKKGVITMEKLLDLLVLNPRERFNVKYGGFSVWDLNKEYVIDSKDFLSIGKSTPFNGMKVYGENLLTVLDNDIIYKK